MYVVRVLTTINRTIPTTMINYGIYYQRTRGRTAGTKQWTKRTMFVQLKTKKKLCKIHKTEKYKFVYVARRNIFISQTTDVDEPCPMCTHFNLGQVDDDHRRGIQSYRPWTVFRAKPKFTISVSTSPVSSTPAKFTRNRWTHRVRLRMQTESAVSTRIHARRLLSESSVRPCGICYCSRFHRIVFMPFYGFAFQSIFILGILSTETNRNNCVANLLLISIILANSEFVAQTNHKLISLSIQMNLKQKNPRKL